MAPPCHFPPPVTKLRSPSLMEMYVIGERMELARQWDQDCPIQVASTPYPPDWYFLFIRLTKDWCFLDRYRGRLTLLVRAKKVPAGRSYTHYWSRDLFTDKERRAKRSGVQDGCGGGWRLDFLFPVTFPFTLNLILIKELMNLENSNRFSIHMLPAFPDFFFSITAFFAQFQLYIS